MKVSVSPKWLGHPVYFSKNIRKSKSTLLPKNKLQRIAKKKLQIGKFVKIHSSSSSSKSLTFLLVCKNLPGKANLKIIGEVGGVGGWLM